MNDDNNQIEWKDGHLYSTTFEDIYYPPEDGIGAAYHVFLQPQKLEERMACSPHIAIGEFGFGTGLNFLTVLSCWNRLPEKGDLTFVSCEQYPLNLEDLTKALSTFPSLKEEAKALCSVYPYRTPGFHSVRLANDRVHLMLLFGDATEMLRELEGTLDAWFLDGFNPKQNPSLWSPELFQLMQEHSHRDSTLATWSVSGMVRRNLEQAGVSWEKIPGFGRKKHSLRGTFPTAKISEQETTLKDTHIGIVGAGIAGCSLVHALKGQECSISLFDAHSSIAQGASGNRYALLVPYYTKAPTPLSQLYGNGYQRALQKVQDLAGQMLINDYHQSGAVHIPVTSRLKTLHNYLQQSPIDERLIQALTAHEASEYAGISLSEDAFYYPEAAYLHPHSLCTALLNSHESCTLYSNMTINAIESSGSGIRVSPSSTQSHVDIDSLFLCTAWNTASLPLAEDIQTNQVRGQLLSQVAATTQSSNLQTLLCYDGYCTPPQQGMHCVGVSYARSNHDDFSLDEQQMILERLHNHAPDCALTHVHDTRVSFRATTYDRMPIAGPLPKSTSLRALLKQEGISNAVYQEVEDTLYVCTGLGSRGFISAILIAEALVCQLLKRPVGLPKSVLKAIHPARLIIRDWKQST